MNRNDSGFRNNQKRYQKALSSLQMPKRLSMEDLEERMLKEKHPMYKLKSLAFSSAAAIVCLLGATGAYAADLGGIRTTFNSWFNGQRAAVEAVPNGDEGYSFYSDGEWIGGGGGVAIDDFGNETPLDADDVYENSFTEQVVEEDGRIYLIAWDRKEDITDLFEKNSTIYVCLQASGQMHYYEIERIDEQDAQGYSYSSDVQPLSHTNPEQYTNLDES